MREESEPPCVAGALACGLRDVLIDLVGHDLVDDALGCLKPETRMAWRSATPIGWVPIQVLENVFGEAARLLERDIADLHTEVARVSIERTMRTLWRVLLRFTTDQALVSRTPVIYGKSYNRGRLEARIARTGQADISLLDWPAAPEWPLRATKIGIETVLRIAGREDVRIIYTRTPDGAAYTATWK